MDRSVSTKGTRASGPDQETAIPEEVGTVTPSGRSEVEQAGDMTWRPKGSKVGSHRVHREGVAGGGGRADEDSEK